MRSIAVVLATAFLATTQSVLAASPGTLAPGGLAVEIVDGAGRGVADSQVHMAIMWPTTALWAKHSRSSDIDATTDSTGVARFALGASAAQKEAIAANGGWLNMTVTSFDAEGRPGRSTAISRYFGSSPDQMAEVSADSQLSSPLKIEQSPTATRAQLAVQPLDTWCSNYHWEVRSTTWNYVSMGSLNSAADTVEADYNYGIDSDITVDVGFEGPTGGWGISGSAHSGEFIGSTYGLDKGSNFHWEVDVPMNFDLLELYADCLEGSHRYQGQAMSEEDGYYTPRNLTYSIGVSQPARNTSKPWSLQSGPGGSYTRSSGNFIKYGGAVTAFGATLGAQSGASKNSSEEWKFGSAQQWHYLYGASQSYTTAPIIYASNN